MDTNILKEILESKGDRFTIEEVLEMIDEELSKSKPDIALLNDCLNALSISVENGLNYVDLP